MHNLNLFFVISLIVVGILFGAIFLWYWFSTGKKNIFLFYWSLGLFSWNFAQLPTIMAMVGGNKVITNYNLFFAIAVPITFIGRIFIHFGLRFFLGLKTTKRTIFLFTVWFVLFVLYYLYFFLINEYMVTTTIVLFEMILFFIPVSFLSLYLCICKLKTGINSYSYSSKVSIVILILFSLAVMFNYAYFIKASYYYPIEIFHVLVRASYPYIITRLATMSLLFLCFMVVKKQVLLKTMNSY
jgi:hypothetical protein